MADIDSAEQTVHLSFYIWFGDHNGTRVVDAVCRALKRGVTCRIVADAPLGSACSPATAGTCAITAKSS